MISKMFNIKFLKYRKIYIVLISVLLVATGLFFLKDELPILKAKVLLKISNTVILDVPFSSQAPTDNWDRNEDCEETSITMVNAYLTGNRQNQLLASDTQEAINNLKKWEGLNLGYNMNTGADATTRLAEGAFNLKVKQIFNFTEADLKIALTNNYPILLPINAKLLGNNNYINGGPLYHMIVIRGFKNHTFIVNDPGLSAGNGNEYSFDILKKAAADWNQVTKSMDNTRKIALIIYK